MKIFFGKDFNKKYKKLRHNIQKKVDQRILMFSQNPFDPILNNHPLSGEYTGYRSINITGDYRALYEALGQDKVQFITIGTHSELYS